MSQIPGGGDAPGAESDTTAEVKLIACFGPYPYNPGMRHLSFLLPDGRTSFGRQLVIEGGDDELVAVVVKLGGDREEIRRQLRSWGQGSLYVWPSKVARAHWSENPLSALS